MPSHPERVRTASLSEGYQFGDARPIYCFDSSCKGEIVGEIVWLGETYGGVSCEFPFHPRCADQPWPLYEVRRSRSVGLSVESTPITSDYATDYSQRSPYVTDRDTGDEA